jgi:hypothetical protein
MQKANTMAKRERSLTHTHTNISKLCVKKRLHFLRQGQDDDDEAMGGAKEPEGERNRTIDHR